MRVSPGWFLAAALAVVACGDGTTNPGTGGNPGGTPGTCTSTGANITVANNSFSPSCTKVAAGTTVTWTWSATAALHNVTFQTGSSSANQSSGTFQRAFPNTGVFPYQCTLHVGMTAEIRVE